MTCSEYMSAWIARAGGYLSNPDATTACKFCSLRTTDELLDLSFNIKYSNRWRDFGIFTAFIVFNVCGFPGFPLACFVLTRLFLDCCDLPRDVLVPYEAVGQVEAEEVDS